MARAYLDKEKEKQLTVFGKETTFDGVLEFSDVLHIAGSFKGTIEARGALMVLKTAECTVDHIHTSSIVIEGKVSGNLEALERIEMKSGSEIRGDIRTSRLRIADNVLFDGTVTMIQSNVNADIFTNSIEDIKAATLLTIQKETKESTTDYKNLEGQKYTEQAEINTFSPLDRNNNNGHTDSVE